jgi:two-component system sensor histidine kinase KdpD
VVDPDRAHAQALCDQLGLALERAAAELAATRAHAQAQLQSMRNTMLSAVAHDHRTPLATIISAAGALHDQAERLGAPQRQRLASTILDEASQLARITDNTLQLARLDAVGLDLTRDWESPEELIGSVLRRLRQRDPAHRLRARVPAGLPLIRCDAVLMVQLIDNLVDNALKHAGTEGPVEVTAQVRDGRMVVGVRDRGPGVSAELLPRLFEPFSRGEQAATARASPAPRARGTGVGLALCRAIARVHGGELTVRQRRGGGACFEVSLPLEPLPPAPDGSIHPESSM